MGTFTIRTIPEICAAVDSTSGTEHTWCESQAASRDTTSQSHDPRFSYSCQKVFLHADTVDELPPVHSRSLSTQMLDPVIDLQQNGANSCKDFEGLGLDYNIDEKLAIPRMSNQQHRVGSKSSPTKGYVETALPKLSKTCQASKQRLNNSRQSGRPSAVERKNGSVSKAPSNSKAAPKKSFFNSTINNSGYGPSALHVNSVFSSCVCSDATALSTSACSCSTLELHSAYDTGSEIQSTLTVNPLYHPSNLSEAVYLNGFHFSDPHNSLQQRSMLNTMALYIQKDPTKAMVIADNLLQLWGFAVVTEAVTTMLPVAATHPAGCAKVVQFMLGHLELAPEQIWATHVLVLRAPQCVVEMLKCPHPKFKPFQALVELIMQLDDRSVGTSIVHVLHHAAAADVPVAVHIDLTELMSSCERLGCSAAARDLLVVLWQQSHHLTDAAQNCLARIGCPASESNDLPVSLEMERKINCPAALVKDCCMLIPTDRTPYFARHMVQFPAVRLADVAPSSSEVKAATLGTGMCGVVIKVALCGKNYALKVPYRTAQANLELKTELETHKRIWGALAKGGHTPSPHLCLARFVTYTHVSMNSHPVRMVDGIAMPLMHGTLWTTWYSLEPSKTVAEVALMAYTLADGLCSLHDAHCVHNDLHPQNVGIRTIHGYSECYVLDLGRVVAAGAPCEVFRASGSFWPAWHPPEVISDSIRDGHVRLTPAADTWVFGCIIVSMLRGAAPDFTAMEQWTPGQWHALARGKQWLKELVSLDQKEAGLWKIARDCLVVSVADRPSMVAVREALRSVAETGHQKM